MVFDAINYSLAFIIFYCSRQEKTLVVEYIIMKVMHKNKTKSLKVFY